MIRLLVPPNQGILGRLLISHTAGIAHVESVIRRMGFRPANHKEIKPEDAENTPHILVAIGEEVPHPETQEPSYRGYKKNGEPVHLLAKLRDFQPNIEIAIVNAA